MPDIPNTELRSDVGADPRTERARHAVIEAGMRLLLDQGPDGINHAAISSAAGVSRTTLYKYWPTRAKLLLEILTAFDAHPQMSSSGDLRTDLLLLLEETQTAMSDPTRCRVFSSMLAQAQWDEDVNEARNSLRAIPLGQLEALLSAASERDEIIGGVVPIAAAGRLIGPLMFAALVAGEDAMAVDIESILDDWLATVRP